MLARSKALESILAKEGGYVNNPDDSGGATNWGITVAVARKHGFNGNMADMPRSAAAEIYARTYWDPINGDELAAMSETIALEVFDTGVNMGPGRAAKFLQRVLTVFNGRGSIYPDLVADGAIGAVTLNALAAFLQHRGTRGELVLLVALNSLQGAFYIELAERREKDEAFVYGWLDHRVTGDLIR